MRRFLSFVFLLGLFASAALVVYAYTADLSPHTRLVETPAVGVGFSE
ncbi:MAG: hypothetical protein AAGF90_08730 [Pseudomonadota bacterium]